MAKKIFDIIPPEKIEKDKEPAVKTFKEKISEQEIVGEIKEKAKAIVVGEKIKKKGFKVGLAIVPLFLVLLIFLALQVSKAEIEIWPKTELITFETKLTIDVNADEIDLSYKIIPAYVLESKKTLYEEFDSTGKILKKAEGVIRLYNEYSTKSETWLKGTRFVSSEGKLFKSKDRIIVPGAELKDGKLVPRYVDVNIIAAEAGENYNIEPTHFSIYVFRGTPRYTKFYGESLKSMTGGGDSLQVTEQDLELSEQALVKKAKSASENDLKSNILEGQIFLEDILETEVLEKFSLTKTGDEAEKFSFKVKTESKTLLFEKKDIENYVRRLVSFQDSSNKLLYKESLKIDYTPQTINFDTGKAMIDLNISVEIYSDISLNMLKKELMGKSLAGTKVFLENQPEIKEVKVEFWPFWVRSVPKDIEKININYSFINSSI
ncbi:MAG TPA: hypothetical protein ENH90_01450 [bacterium]|nr:hypothetical protein [bacterium]